MYEMKKYIDLFKSNCKQGKVYERQELEQLLSEHRLNYNITAFTYNQWNKGMSSINPLFEKTGRGLYTYLGDVDESKYTGKVIHKPQGENNVYHIADWDNGNLMFLNGYSSFNGWKESLDAGERFIQEGTLVKVNFAGSERIWGIGIENKDAQNIDPESALGKALLGLKEGDSCSVNRNKGSIIAIIYT